MNNTQDTFLQVLKNRFEKNSSRHSNIKWENVLKKLESNPKKLQALQKMEETGGEPDIVFYEPKFDQYIFFDCSPESPKGRRSFCYDQKALESRKEHKPKDSAENVANSISAEILTEEQYRFLQTLGKFDTTTSSWLKTPQKIRELGGAIFGDYRYGTVFIYHNGAESYYAARGFRTCLKV